MSHEPSYPADAVPGRIDASVASPAAAPDPSPATGAKEVTPQPAEAAGGRRWQGVAIGVGSAAIAAALLYANRSKR
jgi:hypothetical protein